MVVMCTLKINSGLVTV